MSKNWKRNRTCGSLSISDSAKIVTINGWVSRVRNLGRVMFVDVRDRWGRVQCVFEGQESSSPSAELLRVRAGYVISLTGLVRRRGSLSEDKPDEVVEIEIHDITILGESPPLAFDVESDEVVGDDVRLTHRVLDLRRQFMQKRMIRRHMVWQKLRTVLNTKDFVEIETPILGRSTPEGARDFLIPSRQNLGSFYALPQSPQIFKQLLMVSGYERYYQICRCFRDEASRSDRQLEFSQLDVEMSFVDQEDILDVWTSVCQAVVSDVYEGVFPSKISRLTAKEALHRYGSDRPDLRFKLPLFDFSAHVCNLSSPILKEAHESGNPVIALVVEGGGKMSRKHFEGLQEIAREVGSVGITWAKRTEDAFTGPLSKHLPPTGLPSELASGITYNGGDVLIVCTAPDPLVYEVFGHIRAKIADYLELRHGKDDKWLWITDFPLFHRDASGSIASAHHPFTSPHPEDIPLLSVDPLAVRSKAYDLTLNGIELGSGSLRIHDPKLQKEIFSILGLSDEIVRERFGFFLDNLSFAAPPHGGFAMGLDRLLMVLEGLENIREVIPFPKTTTGICRVSQAPSSVDDEQLRAIGIQSTKGGA